MRKEYNFSEMTGKKNPYARRLKKQVTIRLGVEAIEYFKELSEATGIPYLALALENDVQKIPQRKSGCVGVGSFDFPTEVVLSGRSDKFFFHESHSKGFKDSRGRGFKGKQEPHRRKQRDIPFSTALSFRA